MQDDYRPGDPYVICDASGFKVRMSETVKQWNGLRVLRRFADERNPQDFVRARPERSRIYDARPEPADSFVLFNQVDPDTMTLIRLRITVEGAQRDSLAGSVRRVI